jgi:hypothetical protein
VSAFQDAFAAYTRLKEAEDRMLAGLGARNPSEADIALMKSVDHATRTLLSLPAENGAQTAAKFAIAAAEYDLPTAGISAEAVGLLVGEVCRFLTAAHLTASARAA